MDFFGEIITGKTPSKKKSENYGNYMPFIKTPDMHSNIFTYNSGESLSEIGANSQSKKILPANSLLCSCIGTPGVVSISSAPCQTNQQINALIPKDIKYIEFLYFSVIGLKETMKLYGATGATMFNLSKGKFATLNIIKPDNKVICKFNKAISSNFDLILSCQKKNDNLQQTRDFLLPKLISGDIEVIKEEQ